MIRSTYIGGADADWIDGLAVSSNNRIGLSGYSLSLPNANFPLDQPAGSLFDDGQYFSSGFFTEFCDEVSTGLDDSPQASPTDGPQYFPNPTIGRISVKGVSGKLAYKVYDITGRLVKTGTEKCNGLLNINLGDVTPGTYILTLSGRSVNYTTRIVKE